MIKTFVSSGAPPNQLAYVMPTDQLIVGLMSNTGVVLTTDPALVWTDLSAGADGYLDTVLLTSPYGGAPLIGEFGKLPISAGETLFVVFQSAGYATVYLEDDA